MRCVKSVMPHDGWSNSSRPGTTGRRNAALRQRDTRLREIARGDHDVGAAALELVLHAGLIELVGHLRHALERNADERRHPRRRARPLRDGEDESRRGDADDENQAHVVGRRCGRGEERRESMSDDGLRGVRRRRPSYYAEVQPMFTTVLYASISLLRSSTSISSEIDASSAAAITWCSSTGSPRTKRWM